MKCTFATYEHTAIGFPGVVLKWTATDGRWDSAAYVVIKGIIQPWKWHWRNTTSADVFKDMELKLFDDYVRTHYGSDKTVQG